ncbi:MAG TPA: hypothetical protein VGM87_10105 [Roseomonas sp.]|jgi:hypothetical protein
MQLRHLLPALRATRLRRAVALAVALVFLVLSAGTVFANTPVDGPFGGASSDIGLVFQTSDPGDQETSGLRGSQHALPCHCHAVIGGDPEPYAIPLAAKPLNGARPVPEQSLRSLAAAPPHRPPCT